jgi:hypothetical protein
MMILVGEAMSIPSRVLISNKLGSEYISIHQNT